MKRKTISFLLAVTLVTGMYGSSAVSVFAEEQENVTLTLVEAITSPARTEIIRTLCDKFEEEHPGVTVEIVSPPSENANTKIAQMLMAEEKIDVLEVRDQTFAQYSNNGWLGTMDEYVADWDGMDTLSETAKFYMHAYRDETYMIPYGFYEKALYYRKDWFEEAGIDVPETWEEMVDAAIALTDAENNRYGYSFRGGAGGFSYLDYIITSNVGSEGLASLIYNVFTSEDSTIYSTPEALEAAELYKKLYEEGSPTDSIAWGFTEMVQGFVGGTTAMLIQDPEVITTCKESMEEGTWGVAPIPKGTSGEGLIPTGFAGWGITSYTEYADLAAELVLFLSEEENNTYFDELNSLIPIHETAAENSEIFKSESFSGYMEMLQNPDVYPATSIPYNYQAFSELNTQADKWTQSFLMGEITAEDLLQTYDDFWLNALEEEGVLW